MKTLIKSTVLVFALCFSHYCLAQNVIQDKKTTSTNTNNNLVFQCDSIKHDLDAKKITLTGNVTIKSDKFECLSAENAVFDISNQKITLFGFSTFSIKGEIVNSISQQNERKIEYRIGENRVYVF